MADDPHNTYAFLVEAERDFARKKAAEHANRMDARQPQESSAEVDVAEANTGGDTPMVDAGIAEPDSPEAITRSLARDNAAETRAAATTTVATSSSPATTIPPPPPTSASANPPPAPANPLPAPANPPPAPANPPPASTNPPPPPHPDSLHLPLPAQTFLAPYLPPQTPNPDLPLPFTTLTYAQSLDARIALAPGTQTALSGPETKALTHYLRSRHDAILIGVRTAIADDPGLNCRIAGAGGYGGEDWKWQPRPVILDPDRRWDVKATSKVVRLAKDGKGRPPWIFVAEGKALNERQMVLEAVGGTYVEVPTVECAPGRWMFPWAEVSKKLGSMKVKSVMVEGGAAVIKTLLRPETKWMVDAVVVTIAPVYLGHGGVEVVPGSRVDRKQGEIVPAVRLKGVSWRGFGEDVVMCGRVRGDHE